MVEGHALGAASDTQSSGRQEAFAFVSPNPLFLTPRTAPEEGFTYPVDCFVDELRHLIIGWMLPQGLVDPTHTVTYAGLNTRRVT
jgi:hypothetical protein